VQLQTSTYVWGGRCWLTSWTQHVWFGWGRQVVAASAGPRPWPCLDSKCCVLQVWPTDLCRCEVLGVEIMGPPQGSDRPCCVGRCQVVVCAASGLREALHPRFCKCPVSLLQVCVGVPGYKPAGAVRRAQPHRPQTRLLSKPQGPCAGVALLQRVQYHVEQNIGVYVCAGRTHPQQAPAVIIVAQGSCEHWPTMGLLTRWTVHRCVLYHVCTTAVVFEGGRRGPSGLQQQQQQLCVGGGQQATVAPSGRSLMEWPGCRWRPVAHLWQ
jgi:hypothetical protein